MVENTDKMRQQMLVCFLEFMETAVIVDSSEPAGRSSDVQTDIKNRKFVFSM